jgi:hypothetical protein
LKIYLKHIVNKFLDGAFPVIVLLVAVEVQVEPMSKFDLKADSDDVFPFLLRHIYDKAAKTKSRQIFHYMFIMDNSL